MELISIWLPTLPSFALALVAIFVPGLLWGLAFGLRGLLLAIASPLLSTFLISTGAIVAGVIGFWWGWVFLGLYTLAVSAVTWGIVATWRVKHGTPPRELAPRWLLPEVLLGVPIVAAVSGWAAIWAIGTPSNPVQTWDGTFHMSAARLIFSTGNGSTFHIGSLASPNGGNLAFYPAGWHDLVALVMEASGDAVLASNVTSIVFIAFIWPFTAAMLTAVLFPKLRFAPFVATLLAAASTAFPERVASYGTLWPILYAYAMIPLALALSVVFIRGNSPDSDVFRPQWNLFALLLVSLAGIGLVHPQGVLAFLVLGIWLLIGKLIMSYVRPDSATKSGRIFLSVTVPALLVFVYLLTFTNAAQITINFDKREPVGTATGELVGAVVDAQLSQQGYGNGGGWILFAVLLALGFIALLVLRQQRWLIPAWMVSAYLLMAAATMTLPGYGLVGFWYSDPVRLGAIIPLVGVPIMAIGAGWALNALGDLLVKRVHWNYALVGLLIGTIAFGTVYVTTGGLGRHVGSLQLWINYIYRGETGLNGLVGEEELEMIGRVSEELPEDAVVLGSPFTGAPLVFTVGGVETVFKIYAKPAQGDMLYLATNFDAIETDPEICRILQDNGIEYFYHDPVLYRVGTGSQAPWFHSLENPGPVMDKFEEIDSGGSATLYRITVCD